MDITAPPVDALSSPRALADLTSLVARVAAGDEEALAALYDRTSAAVHGLVLRVVRDRAVAEEVTLAVYTQAWRRAASYDATRGTPAAWLLNMARSRALDRLRGDGARQSHEAGPDLLETARADADGPDDAAARTEVQRLVRAALDALTPDQRRVIEVAYYRGLSQTEIARVLDLPLGTVKTRTRAALLVLRERLGPLLGVVIPKREQES